MLAKLGIGKSQTLGSALAQYSGVGPGFDLLRIVLSLYIFYGHTLWIAGATMIVDPVAATAPVGAGGVVFDGWTRPFHVAAVPVFFALSGFLVMGSAFRLRATSTFLAFRFLRIFPALIMEVLLCAFILGPLLSSYSIGQYFSDSLFIRYLGNIGGWISFHLPGLFNDNPVKGIVNANLWTLPSEFDCYLITALLMMTKLIYNRKLFTLCFALATFGLGITDLVTDFAQTRGILPPIVITYYFFMGVLFYHWQDRIPARWGMFFACSALSFAMLMGTRTVFIEPAFITYCVVFFGLINIPKLPLIRTGDYSYGIYLYGFPIAQALVACFPAVFIGHKYLLLACATVCTCSFAAISWHLLEKRFLLLKRHLPKRLFPVPARSIQQTPEQRARQAQHAT